MKTLDKKRATKRLLGAMLSLAMLVTTAFAMPVHAAEINADDGQTFGGNAEARSLPVAELGVIYTSPTSITSYWSSGGDSIFGLSVVATVNNGNPTNVYITLEKQDGNNFVKVNHGNVPVDGKVWQIMVNQPITPYTNYRIRYQCNGTYISSVKISAARSLWHN